MSRGDSTTNGNRPAVERRVEDAIVAIRMSRLCAGIKAVAEGEINQRREGQHACEGDSVKRSYPYSKVAGGKVPDLKIGGCQQAQHDHQTC